jgi:hypothetical protein
VRLIQQNKIYSKYIEKMSEIVQEKTELSSIKSGEKHIKGELMKHYKLSELIEKYGDTEFETEYVCVLSKHNNYFNFGNIKSQYDCITEIAIKSDDYSDFIKLKYSEIYSSSFITNKKNIIHTDTFLIIDKTDQMQLLFNDDLEKTKIINIFIKGFKFKNMPETLIKKNNIYIDTMKVDITRQKYNDAHLRRNCDLFQYVLMGARILCVPIDVQISLTNYTDSVESTYYDIDFDSESDKHPYIFLHRCAKEISEYNMKLFDNDIWITRFDNKKDKTEYYTNGDMRATIFLDILDIVGRYKKYGYSILKNEIIERPYYGVVFNYYENLYIPYGIPKKNTTILKYNIYNILLGDTMNSKIFKILNHFDTDYDIDMSFDSAKTNFLHMICSTKELPMSFELTNIMMCKLNHMILSITVPTTKINDWNELNISFDCLIMDKFIREIIETKNL